jgi:uncharacterized protein
VTTQRGALRLIAAFWLTLVFALPWSATAQVAVPPLQGHVTDLTETFTAEQKATLEQQLTAFEAQKGSQLAVLLVPTTAPEAIEQYAIRVAEQWKLGRKKVDDGVILIVAKNDRSLRIEVGYGLEGALTDLTSKRIISESILPRFKQGDFFGGVVVGIEQIIKVVNGESLPEPTGRSSRSDQSLRQLIPFLFIVALGVGGVLRRVMGNVPGSLITGIVVTAVAWLVVGTLLIAVLAGAAAALVTLLGISSLHHGMGGHYRGGRGGWGGGGGFRGGGGGFGGGGSSGRW